MEPHPGVFVSNVSPDEWEPDPEVPGSEVHELMSNGGVSAELSRYTSVEGPTTWTPKQREIFHVLEGSVRIQITDGPTIELGPGDVASLPADQETTWHITAPFKELWVQACVPPCPPRL